MKNGLDVDVDPADLGHHPHLIQEKPVLAPSMEVLGLRLDCRSREKMPSSVTFVGTLSALKKV